MNKLFAFLFLFGLLIGSFAEGQEFVDYGQMEVIETYNFDGDVTGWNVKDTVRDEAKFIAESLSYENGILRIEARQTSRELEDVVEQSFTSGSIESQMTLEEGYVEALIKMPKASGAWPFFYMIDSEGNELRVVESLGGKPYYSSIMNILDGKFPFSYEDNSGENLSEFHLYSVQWDASAVRWFFDGELVAKYEGIEWAGGLRARLGMSVGGWAGNPETRDYPAVMEIDYVNFYNNGSDKEEKSHHVEEFDRSRPITYEDLEFILDALRERIQSDR